MSEGKIQASISNTAPDLLERNRYRIVLDVSRELLDCDDQQDDIWRLLQQQTERVRSGIRKEHPDAVLDAIIIKPYTREERAAIYAEAEKRYG